MPKKNKNKTKFLPWKGDENSEHRSSSAQSGDTEATGVGTRKKHQKGGNGSEANPPIPAENTGVESCSAPEVASSLPIEELPDKMNAIKLGSPEEIKNNDQNSQKNKKRKNHKKTSRDLKKDEQLSHMDKEEMKPNESNSTNTAENMQSSQDDMKPALSSDPNEWKQEVTPQIVPDCPRQESEDKERSWNLNAAEFTPKASGNEMVPSDQKCVFENSCNKKNGNNDCQRDGRREKKQESIDNEFQGSDYRSRYFDNQRRDSNSDNHRRDGYRDHQRKGSYSDNERRDGDDRGIFRNHGEKPHRKRSFQTIESSSGDDKYIRPGNSVLRSAEKDKDMGSNTKQGHNPTSSHDRSERSHDGSERSQDRRSSKGRCQDRNASPRHYSDGSRNTWKKERKYSLENKHSGTINKDNANWDDDWDQDQPQSSKYSHSEVTNSQDRNIPQYYESHSTKNEKVEISKKTSAELYKSGGLLDPRMTRESEKQRQRNEVGIEKIGEQKTSHYHNEEGTENFNKTYDPWSNTFSDTNREQRSSYPQSKHKDKDSRMSLGEKKSGDRLERYSRDNSDRNFEKTDDEYREFNATFKWNEEYKYIKVIEKEQDLFEMPKDYSLGHCVAEDLRMGSGIAVTFKRDFKGLDELLCQRQKQGGLAVLENNNRYIYYLVTKKLSTGKPSYQTFWSSLKKMREHIISHGVQKLAIPRIGCGLDKLEWVKVKFMIEFLFKKVDIEIVVCNFQQMEDAPQKDYQSTRLVYHHEPLKDIAEYTIILYFSTEDGHISKDMQELDKKFNFLQNFKQSFKKLGVPVRFTNKEKYILYGCIVRKKNKDQFDFKAFANCLYEITKNNRKDQYEYVALEPVYDETDEVLNEKIITLLRNCLKKVDIYLCSGTTFEEPKLSHDKHEKGLQKTSFT